MQIDLNSDLGESFGNWHLGQDTDMLALVSSANIACGFHAGDPSVMRQTVRLAAVRGVAVGAHPSYPDLRGFGRFDMELPPALITDDLLYQLGALATMCQVEGVQLSYVKPHGALYNRMSEDVVVATAVAEAVRLFDSSLPVLVLAQSAAETVLKDRGLRVKREAFIDRAYLPDGRLQSRREVGSVIQDPAEAARRALEIVQMERITAVDGSTVELAADSLCIHGDSPKAVALARAVRQALEQAGVSIGANWHT